MLRDLPSRSWVEAIVAMVNSPGRMDAPLGYNIFQPVFMFIKLWLLHLLSSEKYHDKMQ